MKTILKIVTNEEGLYIGDLKNYFRAVWNAPNKNLPYHNLQHMFGVTESVYKACAWYGITGVKLRNLLIAALFHDYDHTGSNDDKINIQRAVNGLKKFISTQDEGELLDIVSLITATQYPHIDYGEDFKVPLSWDIIRDADITYTLTNEWVTPVFGLGQELNLTQSQMLLGQVPFLQNNLKLSSDWGKANFSDIIEERIVEVNSIIETLMS